MKIICNKQEFEELAKRCDVLDSCNKCVLRNICDHIEGTIRSVDLYEIREQED